MISSSSCLDASAQAVRYSYNFNSVKSSIFKFGESGTEMASNFFIDRFGNFHTGKRRLTHRGKSNMQDLMKMSTQKASHVLKFSLTFDRFAHL